MSERKRMAGILRDHADLAALVPGGEGAASDLREAADLLDATLDIKTVAGHELELRRIVAGATDDLLRQCRRLAACAIVDLLEVPHG